MSTQQPQASCLRLELAPHIRQNMCGLKNVAGAVTAIAGIPRVSHRGHIRKEKESKWCHLPPSLIPSFFHSSCIPQLSIANSTAGAQEKEVQLVSTDSTFMILSHQGS